MIEYRGVIIKRFELGDDERFSAHLPSGFVYACNIEEVYAKIDCSLGISLEAYDAKEI